MLESQFSQLLQQINSTRDFESIRLAHDHFLSNLLAQSFILLKPVRSAGTLSAAEFLFSGSFNKRFCPQVFHCLNEILELCHNFCSLVSQSVASLDERGTAQLDILVKVEPLISICPSNAGKCKVHSYEHVQISGLQTAVLLTV